MVPRADRRMSLIVLCKFVRSHGSTPGSSPALLRFTGTGGCAEIVEGAKRAGVLNRRSQPGGHPLHRIGLSDDLIDVVAIDALKRAHLESEPGRLDARQDHWTQTFGTEMGLNCNAAGVEQDREG